MFMRRVWADHLDGRENYSLMSSLTLDLNLVVLCSLSATYFKMPGKGSFHAAQK